MLHAEIECSLPALRNTIKKLRQRGAIEDNYAADS